MIRKYTAVLKINWIQALEYRANAVVGVIAILSGLLIEYQIWSLIFISQGLESIKGFSFEELMIFIFLSIIVGQLKSSWHTSGEMIDGIRTGDINKYLIRPISYFNYHFMMFIGVNSLYYTVYSFLLFFFIIIFPGLLFPGIINIVGFLIALLISVFLSYSIYYIMICCAFWFGEVRAIVVAYNISMTIISGQYIPIRLFPEYVLDIMKFTPILYLVDFPVSIATGRIPVDSWGGHFMISIVWCITMWLIGSLVYNKGIRNYEAYGS
tara:strand:+ start:1075 stop:1875 length:801 start_codon:yes stop_codon:yes gene_type:complete